MKTWNTRLLSIKNFFDQSLKSYDHCDCPLDCPCYYTVDRHDLTVIAVPLMTSWEQKLEYMLYLILVDLKLSQLGHIFITPTPDHRGRMVFTELWLWRTFQNRSARTSMITIYLSTRLFSLWDSSLFSIKCCECINDCDDDDNLFMDRSIRPLKGNFWAIWK